MYIFDGSILTEGKSLYIYHFKLYTINSKIFPTGWGFPVISWFINDYCELVISTINDRIQPLINQLNAIERDLTLQYILMSFTVQHGDSTAQPS